MESEEKDKLAQDIFTAMGAEQLSDEEKGAIFAKMIELVQSRVIVRLGDELSEDDKNRLSGLIEAGDDEGAENFINEKSPNFDSFFEEEAKKLKQELLIEFAE